jgi:hypothetical protein
MMRMGMAVAIWRCTASLMMMRRRSLFLALEVLSTLM